MSSAGTHTQGYPVMTVGGGILGVTLAYWLSHTYQANQIALIQAEGDVAQGNGNNQPGAAAATLS